MKYLIIFLGVLALAACSPEIVPAITGVVPTLSPTPTAGVLAVPPAPTEVPTLSPARLLAIVGDVYIRSEPDGAVVGSLRRGDCREGVCVGNWCEIDGGYIWRGCTDDNPERKRCEAK